MTHIIYVLRDGSERKVDVPDGQTVMDGSVRSNLPGIIAECGGSCSCATCHVYLNPAWAYQFDDATDEERELLEFAEGSSPESRLACQLVVRPDCEGARVTVAVIE
ncbi:2Fe-2S iron-sulfur cluster-binding protein [Streptomyces sp. NPDC055092]